eukprot:27491-Prymnesium_polylepis.1
MSYEEGYSYASNAANHGESQLPQLRLTELKCPPPDPHFPHTVNAQLTAVFVHVARVRAVHTGPHSSPTARTPSNTLSALAPTSVRHVAGRHDRIRTVILEPVLDRRA